MVTPFKFKYMDLNVTGGKHILPQISVSKTIFSREPEKRVGTIDKAT